MDARRSLLFAGALVTAGAAVYLAGTRLGGDAPPPAAIAPPSPTPAASPDPRPGDGREVELVRPREREEASEGVAWDVRVIDGSGRSLTDALLVATGPDGEERRSTGPVLWRDLAPGAWSLSAEHERFPTHHARAELVASRPNRTIVRLDRSLRLSGSVRDRFGTPSVGTRVWFLRGGESHPTDGDQARTRMGAVTDRSGAFRIDLPEAGEWRVSIGGLAGAEMLSEPQELEHGSPSSLEVVLGGATHLEVALDRPLADPIRRGALQVLERRPPPEPQVVLERPTDDSASLGAVRLSRDDPADLERLRDIGALPGGRRPDLQRPDPQQLDDQQDELERERLRAEAGEAGETVHAPPEWLARTTLALRDAQSFPVPNLPAGSDLRIALVLDEARFEAPQVFRLRPDETTRVEITLPGAAPLAGEGSEVLPLAMRVRVVPLPPEAPRPGFTWR